MRCALVLLMLALLAWPVAAQAPAIPASKIPNVHDPCAEPATVAGAPAWGIAVGNAIAYCSGEATVDAAKLVAIQFTIDGVVVVPRLLPDPCTTNGQRAVRCYVTATRAILTAVAAPGAHTVVLTPIDPASGLLRSPYPALTILTGCPALNLSVSPWVTVPVYVPVGTWIGQSNQMLLTSFFASKAVAEAAGYSVEWQVQFFANSAAASDRRLVVGGRCRGTPQ